MNNEPEFLNLSKFKTKIFKISLDDGVTMHRMKPASVQDFIDNTEIMQELGTEFDLKTEIKVLNDMLSKSFPTVPEGEFLKLEMAQMNELLDNVRKINGEDKVTEELKKGENVGSENPTETGQ